MGNRGRAGDRRNIRPVVIGAAMAVLVGGAGYGAYALVGGAGRDGGDTATQAETVKSGPLPADEVTAAAMTEEGGHGGDAAGPIVAAVLRAGG